MPKEKTDINRGYEMDAEFSKDEKIVIDDLKKAGINVSSVSDLVSNRASLKAAIPILIKHLQIKHHPKTKELIVNTLKKYNGPMIASDHQILLDNDPEYQERARKREAERTALKVKLGKEAKPLVDDLRKAGVIVDSVYDLVNSKQSFPAIIPVLLKHLHIRYDHRIKEGIVRALIDPASVIGFQKLYDEFCNTPTVTEKEDFVVHEYKWLLGAALAEASRIETLPKILELLRDKRHGEGRERLIFAVKRLPKKERDVLLRELNKDPDLNEIIKKAKLKFSTG